ncbi:hypothetical protein [Roseateles sp.]|uniref:hypothetical protein n=1 Tax=Roseateles sp. TaxID=1971397 RepID=UPI0031E3A7B7
MNPLKRIEWPQRPSELKQGVRAVATADAMNDEEGGTGRAHPWAEYSHQSAAWLHSNPTASSEEIEAANRAIAAQLGL